MWIHATVHQQAEIEHICPDIDTRDVSLYRQANNDISIPFLNCLLTGTGIESNEYPSGRKKVQLEKGELEKYSYWRTRKLAWWVGKVIQF